MDNSRKYWDFLIIQKNVKYLQKALVFRYNLGLYRKK